MELPARSGRLVTVSVENDHLEIWARPGGSLIGLAELIWNSLDAEADSVAVRVAVNGLDGVDAVEVTDDGHGMTYEAVITDFSHLGGSWKRNATHSKNHVRLLHGKHGQGRWRAFSVGDVVRWATVAETPDGRQKTVITGRRAKLTQFEVSAPEATDDPVGTVVTIDAVQPESATALLNETAGDKLTARLAPYFEQNPNVSVSFRGRDLDPRILQSHREEYGLEIAGNEHGPLSLLVIEWTKDVDRELFLCDEHGIALHSCPPGIQAPAFDFTAYLRWGGFREYEPELPTADMHPHLSPAVEAGRAKLREHFKERGAELQATVIEQWKNEKVYPYEGEAASPLELIERDLFDVVAVAAAPAVNSSDQVIGRQLSLRLMRAAIEQSPAALRNVLREVLRLPPEKLAELDQLLERTSLTSIISLGKVVADRLDFLEALGGLVFDPVQKKAVLERSQLHRILANEIWLFGDEYTLAVDDEGLGAVLQQHVALLGRDLTAQDADPVTLQDGSRGIVDLMLSAAIRLPVQKREHLVVELKRPSLTLGYAEVTQIERYADAVARDPRFDTIDVQWNFWLVGTEMDDFVAGKASQPNSPRGLISRPLDGRVSIWVKTWAQILDDCEQRLKFVREKLAYKSTTDSAVEYLRRQHAERIPAVLRPAVAASLPAGSDE